MIPEPGDANRDITVTETFHLQTDDELSDKELKQIEADDQAIKNILLGLPEDIYAAVDSYETAQEIWLRVQQMMKGFDIGIQEKTAKLFNKWKSQSGVDMSLLFIKLRICTQLITLNSPHQDQSSFNQNYLQQPIPNPEDITDPTTVMNMALVLMAKVFKLNYSTPTNNNQRISSNPRNRQIAQPGMNMGQDRQMLLIGGYSECCSESKGSEWFNWCSREWKSESDWEWGVGHYARNYTVRPRRRDAAYLQTQLLIAQKEEAGIQLQAEEYDLMAAAADLDEIKKVNVNCILIANLQQASTSGTQTDSAPVYDTDGSAEVHENCDDNEIFNMFTQEEQYTELLEPIPELHQVPQNDNDVISENTSMKQGGETVEQHPANFEETRVKENQEKDKIGSKLDKNRKRVEAEKSLKQLQWVEQEKL
nr:hypothetical protein [Tanacetum cinerariifolium]